MQTMSSPMKRRASKLTTKDGKVVQLAESNINKSSLADIAQGGDNASVSRRNHIMSARDLHSWRWWTGVSDTFTGAPLQLVSCMFDLCAVRCCQLCD